VSMSDTTRAEAQANTILENLRAEDDDIGAHSEEANSGDESTTDLEKTQSSQNDKDAEEREKEKVDGHGEEDKVSRIDLETLNLSSLPPREALVMAKKIFKATVEKDHDLKVRGRRAKLNYRAAIYSAAELTPFNTANEDEDEDRRNSFPVSLGGNHLSFVPPLVNQPSAILTPDSMTRTPRIGGHTEPESEARPRYDGAIDFSIFDPTPLEAWTTSLNRALHRPSPLFNHRALQLWILKCCQWNTGGLKDKPGKSPDYYHSCYCLSGLSAAQHAGGGAAAALGGARNLLKKIDPAVNVVEEKLLLTRAYFKRIDEEKN